MILNEHTVISTSKVVLVPYSKHHVPKYHEWMQDPDIQAATASEPLTLEEEYAMQQSWRQDSDKLTFIVCQPALDAGIDTDFKDQEVKSMIGDVNLFLSVCNDEEAEAEATNSEHCISTNASQQPTKVIGEIELMIARTNHQRQGYGRATLLTFLFYIFHRMDAILRDFCSKQPTLASNAGQSLRETDVSQPSTPDLTPRFAYFRVRINEINTRSLALFESVGFKRISQEANYFGELELRIKVENPRAKAPNPWQTDAVQDKDVLSNFDLAGLLERYSILHYKEERSLTRLP